MPAGPLIDEARRRGEDRLGQMIDNIRSAGGEADGEVGASDAAAAVKHVLNDRSFDGVIVSTLPAGISRWLKMDHAQSAQTLRPSTPDSSRYP